MMRRHWIVAGLCMAPFAGAVGQSVDQTSTLSDTSYSSATYRAPRGFGGYDWSTPLGKIGRLTPEPIYVRIAHSIGKVTRFDINCYEMVSGSNLRDNKPPTDHALGLKACRETDGEGFHAMAEYYVDSQGFRVRAEDGGKAVLFPVTYQFCSHWSGFLKNFKGDPLEQMQLCGVRLHFRSDTAAEELANTDFTHTTDYERVMNWLIENHGEPEDYRREGEVFIPELLPERERKKALEKKRHRSWSWCRPQREELKPKCDASIVLSFDAETGRGQVLLSTAPVWAYAHARQFGGSEGDPLYRVLHGGMTQAPVQHQCMDSFLCEPPPPQDMPEDMLARFRLSSGQGKRE
jgi:hypothetical protein